MSVSKSKVKGKNATVQTNGALSCDKKYAIKKLKADKKFAKGTTAKRFGKAVAQERKRIWRIRTRSSYLFFNELYDFLSSKPSIPDILRKFYELRDNLHTFGSIRNAECAAESLDLVLKDKGEVKA